MVDDVVVVSGGDGTIAQGAEMAADRGVPLAVIPTGTANDFARAAGADEVVVGPDFRDAAKELTGGKGVDVVLDVVGGDAFTDSLRCLAEKGRVLVVEKCTG